MELNIGHLPTGPRNSIADVDGVLVGHCTVDTDTHKTGVTVVQPCGDDLFRRKMVAACHVLNGFGKTTGLMQLEELGSLETPIALTNTLNVGLVHDAMVEYMCRRAEAAGYAITSVNPVVCECNDAALNDIRHRAVGREQVFAAIADARQDFAQGDVGAGKGMTCHGLKGGIGSSSRVMDLGGSRYTLGVLALTNHGCLADLTIQGRNIGREIGGGGPAEDRGSCILVLATDLPMTDRQLRRVLRRCAVGLARLGSFTGHGSGEVMVGFCTANRLEEGRDLLTLTSLRESAMDLPFRAAAEATEEAVLRSMLFAGPVTGFGGTTRQSLGQFWQP